MLGDWLLTAPSTAPRCLAEIARHGRTALPAVATVVLAVVARSGQHRLVVSPIERSASIPLSFPRFPIRKDFKQQGCISLEIGSVVM